MSKIASYAVVSAVSENVKARDYEGLTREFNDALAAGQEWSEADVVRVCQSHGVEPLFLISDVQDAYSQRRYGTFSGIFNHIISVVCRALNKLGDAPDIARYISLAMRAYKDIAFKPIVQRSTVTFNIALNEHDTVEEYMLRAVKDIRTEGGYECAMNIKDEVDDATIYKYVEAIMNAVERNGKSSVIYNIVLPVMQRTINCMKEDKEPSYEDKMYDVYQLVNYGLAVLLTC